MTVRNALADALRLAARRGLGLLLRTSDGDSYRTLPPFIIGDEFVQFATPASSKPIRVPLNRVAHIEVVDIGFADATPSPA